MEKRDKEQAQQQAIINQQNKIADAAAQQRSQLEEMQRNQEKMKDQMNDLERQQNEMEQKERSRKFNEQFK
jgi:hypothetical protein